MQRRTTATRRVAANVEPAIDKTETEVLIDAGTTAEVVEQVGAKTLTYQAKLVGKPKIDESELENETDDFENNDEDVFFESRPQIESVPKNKIDILFDALTSDYPNEPYFYASVTRQPDALGDRFAIPCNTEMPLGVFQFSLQDRFNLLPEIQKLAGSGGRFNVLVYSAEQKPLVTFLRYSYESRGATPVTQPLGIRNLLIPNPPAPKEESANANSGLAQILAQMHHSAQENTRMIIEAIQSANRKPEKTTLETAIEQKVLRDILDPPKQSANELEKTMATLMTMPAMAEGFARKMFPPEQPPAEPQGIFDRLLGNPEVVNRLIDTGGNVINSVAQLAAMKMQQSEQPQPQPQPPLSNIQPLPDPQPLPVPASPEQDELMAQQYELITEILIELETDHPINADNPKFKELAAKYPKIYPLVQMLCKSQDFASLLDQLQDVVDFSEHGLIDEDGDFNSRGLAVKNRLREFYEFVKSA